MILKTTFQSFGLSMEELETLKLKRNVRTTATFDFRTVMVGSPWYVQTAAGIATQVGMNHLGGAKAVTAVKAGITFKHLIASQLIGTTMSGSAGFVVRCFMGKEAASASKDAISKQTVHLPTNGPHSFPVKQSVSVGTDAYSDGVNLSSGVADYGDCGLLSSLPGPDWMWTVGGSMVLRYLITRYVFKTPQNDPVAQVKDTIESKGLTEDQLSEVKDAILAQAELSENVKYIGVPTAVVAGGSNIALVFGGILGVCLVTGIITYSALKTHEHLTEDKSSKDSGESSKQVNNDGYKLTDGGYYTN